MMLTTHTHVQTAALLMAFASGGCFGAQTVGPEAADADAHSAVSRPTGQATAVTGGEITPPPIMPSPSGLGDHDDEKSSSEACASSCSTEGEIRCHGRDPADRCTLNEEGCLVWQDQEPCAPEQVCGDDSCHVCQGERLCDEEGASRCLDEGDHEGGQMQRCAVSARGCLVWQTVSHCPSGTFCDDSNTEPVCLDDRICAEG
ncbi:MAG: hypothetical protein AAFS10_13450, partial [Myxococcota bacterium]